MTEAAKKKQKRLPTRHIVLTPKMIKYITSKPTEHIYRGRFRGQTVIISYQSWEIAQ